MDSIATGLLRMISTTGGMHAGHNAERKKLLDGLVDEGYLFLEPGKLHLPDRPEPEPTYRLTEKAREYLATT
jgi:hypothetical protein